MSRSIIDRLRDIVHAADLAMRHAGDLDAENLAVTAGMRDATLFRMVVLCEAATKLPPEVQALAPEIPWPNIKSMRNLMVHAYWLIDFRVVVDTVNNDLEPLKTAARRLIEILGRDSQ